MHKKGKEEEMKDEDPFKGFIDSLGEFYFEMDLVMDSWYLFEKLPKGFVKSLKGDTAAITSILYGLLQLEKK